MYLFLNQAPFIQIPHVHKGDVLPGKDVLEFSLVWPNTNTGNIKELMRIYTHVIYYNKSQRFWRTWFNQTALADTSTEATWANSIT